MRFREATLDDVPALVAMGERFRSSSTYQVHIPSNMAQLVETFSLLITHETGVIFVAELDRKLVGMIVMLIQPHFFSGDLLAQELVWWMDEAHRGKGLKLLKIAETWARARGAVRMQVSAPTADVERVYMRVGYTRVESNWMRALRAQPPDEVQVIDDAVADPVAYRELALACEYKTIAPGSVFHGIALDAPVDPVRPALDRARPHATVTSSFFRKSPFKQVEPTFIHTDVDMGDWTGILYLTPDPPPDDGTVFWREKATGAVKGTPVHDDHREERLRWMDTTRWEAWKYVPAKFNRLIVFPAPYFHSRAIFDNYGEGDDARLIQLLFGV